jgi:hypothetical protein
VSDCVKMPFTYSARADDYGINLIVERTVINFVREMIPDGQMAGMMGHRPVENEQSFTFTLDQVQEFVWSVVYAVLLLAGTIGGAWALTEAFGGWVGCLLLVAVGGAGTAYNLRKSAERRAERERNAMLAAGREHTRGQG